MTVGAVTSGEVVFPSDPSMQATTPNVAAPAPQDPFGEESAALVASEVMAEQAAAASGGGIFDMVVEEGLSIWAAMTSNAKRGAMTSDEKISDKLKRCMELAHDAVVAGCAKAGEAAKEAVFAGTAVCAKKLIQAAECYSAQGALPSGVPSSAAAAERGSDGLAPFLLGVIAAGTIAVWIVGKQTAAVEAWAQRQADAHAVRLGHANDELNRLGGRVHELEQELRLADALLVRIAPAPVA